MEKIVEVEKEDLYENMDARTARSFACWCIRNTPLKNGGTVWDLLTDDRSKNAVKIAEQFANGKATKEELNVAWAAAVAAAWDAGGTVAWTAVGAATEAAARDAVEAAAWAAAWTAAWTVAKDAAKDAARAAAWDAVEAAAEAAAWAVGEDIVVDAAWAAAWDAAWAAAWDAAEAVQTKELLRIHNWATILISFGHLNIF